VLHHDCLGLRTGSIKTLLNSAQVRSDVLRLLYYISHDYYGRCTLFSTGLIRDLVGILKQHRNDVSVLEYIIPMLQILSVREDMKLEMVKLGVVRVYLALLSQSKGLTEVVTENVVATLLNLCSRAEGLDCF
jgi:hypothetical protein